MKHKRAPAARAHRRRCARFARQFARFVALLTLATATLSPSASATPVTLSGNLPIWFDVGAAHVVTNPQSGAFHDIFNFSIATESSIAVSALFFNGDINGFTATLLGPSGMLATGHTVGSGGSLQNPLAYASTIFVGQLVTGSYEIQISGLDLVYLEEPDPFAPYTLSVAAGAPVAPGVQAAAGMVAEPTSSMLVLTALLVLARRRRR